MHDVRHAFELLELECFPLLSGGKGIHVVAPIQPEAQWLEIRSFAHQVCSALAQADPDRFTVALPKVERRGRIFLDYLHNQCTATAILPYSVRARPGASVAAPITWSELGEIKSAADFTIVDAEQLIRRAAGKRLAGWGLAQQRLPK